MMTKMVIHTTMVLVPIAIGMTMRKRMITGGGNNYVDA
jgi:uncharacterized protein YxeA